MSERQLHFLSRHSNQPDRLRWDNGGWYNLRELRAALSRCIDSLSLPKNVRVLDFGCADSPYRCLFPETADYLRADLEGNTTASIRINDDGTLPLDDSSIDVVLSTQVLEHVVSPETYVRECKRVLRPGGHLILSTHGLWIYHRDPVDYWRWTSDGLQFLIEQQGLQTIDVQGIVGLAAVAVQLFQDATHHHLPGPLRWIYCIILQRTIALLDRLHSASSRRRNAMMYLILAENRK